MNRAVTHSIATFAAVACLVQPTLGATSGSALEEGDVFWAQRAEGRQGTSPAPEPIAHARRAYERALEADPTDDEARWKLLRTLFFQGEHVLTERAERLAAFTQGRDLGEERVAELVTQLGGEGWQDLDPEQMRTRLADEPHAARLFFWTSVQWGLWGRERGKIAAAREGVATRIRDYAEATIALDDQVENAGGYRVLGRLHSEAPKIPFVTGWIDRDRAVSALERCVEIAPDDLLTRLYFAEELIDHHRERYAEGVAILQDLVRRPPNPEWLIEELKAQRDASNILERLGEPAG